MSAGRLRAVLAAAGLALLPACQGTPGAPRQGQTTTIGNTTITTSGSVRVDAAYVD